MGIKKQSTPPVMDLYARLSFAANGETIKVDDQIEMGVDEVERRGGFVGEAFRDNSLSAWNLKVVRPDWNTLMARLESGVSDGVWVYDITRFSRKVLEGERLVELASKGIRVWSHAGEYDLTTADGRRHFRESMVAAAAESDKISERVKLGKRRRARKGRSHGGGRAFAMPGLLPVPDGWEQGDPRAMAPDEVISAERLVVREAYDRLLAGTIGVSTLVGEFARRGIRGATDGAFSRRSLSRMLRRPAVAGLLDHNGEIMGELAGVEPIVTREEWERMCALLDGRKKGRPPSPAHPLSGVLLCATCGRRLSGNNRGNLPPYPDGSVRREYRCVRSAEKAGCGKNHIEAWPIEDAVDEAMRARLGDPRRAAKMAEHLAKISERRSKIDAELTLLQDSADELASKTAAWGLARVELAMTPLLKRITALQAELVGLDEPSRADVSAADAVAAWCEARTQGNILTMRAMVRRAFPRLTVVPQSRHNDHGPDRILWDGPVEKVIT